MGLLEAIAEEDVLAWEGREDEPPERREARARASLDALRGLLD